MFSYERLNAAMADAGISADQRLAIVKAADGTTAAGLPTASAVHSALAPHFDVSSRHIATRALVARGLATNDMGEALFAQAAPPSRINMIAAARSQAKATETLMIIGKVQRLLDVTLDGPIALTELDKILANKGNHPELKEPSDRIALKMSMNRAGLIDPQR